MAFYREKPLIEAFQFGVEPPPMWWSIAVKGNLAYVHIWDFHDGEQHCAAVVKRGKSYHWAQKGDYVIQVKPFGGELSVMKREEFEDKYELIYSE